MSKTINIIDAVLKLNEDLTSKAKVLVNMKLGKKFQEFNVSNYIPVYQTERNDLILVEGDDFAFTVSTWDANFTIGQQIRSEYEAINN